MLHPNWLEVPSYPKNQIEGVPKMGRNMCYMMIGERFHLIQRIKLKGCQKWTVTGVTPRLVSSPRNQIPGVPKWAVTCVTPRMVRGSILPGNQIEGLQKMDRNMCYITIGDRFHLIQGIKLKGCQKWTVTGVTPRLVSSPRNQIPGVPKWAVTCVTPRMVRGSILPGNQIEGLQKMDRNMCYITIGDRFHLIQGIKLKGCQKWTVTCVTSRLVTGSILSKESN